MKVGSKWVAETWEGGWKGCYEQYMYKILKVQNKNWGNNVKLSFESSPPSSL